MYASSPIRPCSAAIVIGIVCDADERLADRAWWRLPYSVSNEPDP